MHYISKRYKPPLKSERSVYVARQKTGRLQDLSELVTNLANLQLRAKFPDA